MDAPSLTQLVQIKWLLVALLGAVVVTMIAFVSATVSRVRETRSRALLRRRDDLLAELAVSEAQGDYDEMLVKSSQMLRSFPNDLMANWYNAVAHHRTGNHGRALSALGRIQAINSVWSVDAVNDFIAQIRSQMTGPRAHGD